VLPQSAPFSREDVDILNRIVSASSPTQRAWLSGFLAGLDAAGGAPVQAAAEPRKAEPLTILFASESGNCERLAGDVGKLARKAGFKPNLVDLAEADLATLPASKKLLVLAATWGEGEPPARATRVYNELMSEVAPRFDGVEFSVLALGDTAYADFCAVGKAIDARLEALGGKRAAPRVDCDLDFETPASGWMKSALDVLKPAQTEPAGNVVTLDFAARPAAEISRDPVAAEVVEHINLNSSRSDKETVHLALGFDGPALPYEPGDALDLYPENDPALVDAVLTASRLGADDHLRRSLTSERDITTLSTVTVERFAAATQHAGAKALIDGGTVKDWIRGRQLIDLFEAFPAALSPEQITGITRPLAPRAYSIASSRKEVEDEAHLLIAAVRYDSHGRARGGVASTFTPDRLKKGAKVRVRLKPNKHFRRRRQL